MFTQPWLWWRRRYPSSTHPRRTVQSAFVAACTLNPNRDERAIAQELRRASATATPNARIVSIADRMLGRDGRMVSAIDSIGRGVMAYEADPFRIDLQ